MKKKLILMMALLSVFAMLFVSCEMAGTDGIDKKGSVFLKGFEQTKGISAISSATEDRDVEHLYWYYMATKTDSGLYNTGKTENFKAVKEEGTGLAGADLGLFSYGSWKFVFVGVKANTPAPTYDEGGNYKNSVVYYGEQSIVVNQNNNYLDLSLEEGSAVGTEIKFDTTNGIYFEHPNIKVGQNFTLSVTDTVGGTPDGTVVSGDAFVETGKVSFKNVTYTSDTDGIEIGEHTFTFTLTQTGVDTGIAKVATYELPVQVSKGNSYTIGGDLTSTEVKGNVIVNSSALSVPETTASKIVPVESETDKTVKTQTKVQTMDLTVTYPVGAKLTGETEVASTDSGTKVTADATIGFEYKSATPTGTGAGQININTATTEGIRYELTLNVAEDNPVLIPVKKTIGKGLEVEQVFHNGTEIFTTALNTGDEYYNYNSETGGLTLYVKHASPIDVITKKAVAVASIGDEKFTTLEAAIAAVGNGGTITLLADVDNANGIRIPEGRDITIDFAGHTYTCFDNPTGSTNTTNQVFQLLKNSNIKFKNGKICVASENSSKFRFIIQNYANLTLEEMELDGANLKLADKSHYVISNNFGTTEFKNTKITAANGDFAFDAYYYKEGDYETPPTVIVSGNSEINGKVEASGGTIDIKSGTVNGMVRVGENSGSGDEYTGKTDSVVTIGKEATVNGTMVVFGPQKLNIYGSVTGCVLTNGNAYNAGSVINIFDGATIAQGEGIDVPVYIPNGTLNVSGGTITGDTAVYFKSTNLNISGGTFTATGEHKEYDYSGNGCNATGDALVIDSCNYPNGIDDVSISGGEFMSTVDGTVAVASFTKNETCKKVKSFITGGTFSSNPGDLVADGYEVISQDNKFRIVEKVPSTSVEILTALNSATSGDKVKIKPGTYYFGNGLNVPSGVTIASSVEGQHVFLVVPVIKSGTEDQCYVESTNFVIDRLKTYSYGARVISTAYTNGSSVACTSGSVRCGSSFGYYSSEDYDHVENNTIEYYSLLGISHNIVGECASGKHDVEMELTIAGKTFKYTFNCVINE